MTFRIGTAGWSIPSGQADSFPGPGTHLERYSRVFACAEIDSSFYRAHQRKTYERWAASTPGHFRFTVKVPRMLTHEGGLLSVPAPLEAFLYDVRGLGWKLGALLVQLPASLPFDAATARSFVQMLRQHVATHVVLEPRHPSWFDLEVDALLREFCIARAAADPFAVEAAARPAGWTHGIPLDRDALRYFRWHGSPQLYRSRYSTAWLSERASRLLATPFEGDTWCIFDNTALGAAIPNALELASILASRAGR